MRHDFSGVADKKKDLAKAEIQRKEIHMRSAKNIVLSKIVFRFLAVFVIAGSLLAGCASTEVTEREEYVMGQLPQPATIWVYDFAATADDIPADSALAGQPDLETAPQTAEQIAQGHKLGAEIANQLVQQINAMGIHAAKAEPGVRPQVNDIVIRGYLLSIEKGEAAERVMIGFGSGESELRTVVEGFQMTEHGLRKLGGGTVESGSGETPGASLGIVGLIATGNPAGLIVSGGMKMYGEESGKSTIQGRAEKTAEEIADVLKERFQQQGWID